MIRNVVLVTLLLVSQNAFSHARLKAAGNVPARSANAGLKIAPCGGVARTLNSKSFVAGSTISVDWEETINHPGRFEIYFSEANDANWVLLKTVSDTMDLTNDLPHSSTTTVTLPNVPCTACTIQLVQVMTENPMAPSLYYSCGDVQLTPSSTPVTPTPPAPTCP